MNELIDFKYTRGAEQCAESVKFDINFTTCMVDVDLLLHGVNTFRCKDGTNKELTLVQKRDILLFVQKERGKFIHVTKRYLMSEK